ncbi:MULTISPECIES: MarR family winged helix-turn-helix transcriptional regulator [unclassified Streptomyces]|uniref:MarR family winged helix-turn-helix transcriptional regulator n=1 Tax=unclassified Streptomyces TaxID=2593676 RepID=UPI001F0352E9|nr:MULTISPECIES: MarR family transcriptional regulator [unclassified Streptomyces]MCH0561732.1 MarR family transcriptional regulator [Streptomyces sp. MUM 2J]MCH0569018.1 MarR family transcriptional regulator [Streptomyces sp. MUM 136J]
MPNPSDELTKQIVGLFAAINRRYSQEAEAAAAAHDLTPLQAKALLAAGDPVPTRHIADRLHAEPSNVTVIVDRLESRGLVVRSPDPDDRRVKRVAASTAGRTVAADLRARMPFAADPLARLTTPQRKTLRELLQLILET